MEKQKKINFSEILRKGRNVFRNVGKLIKKEWDKPSGKPIGIAILVLAALMLISLIITPIINSSKYDLNPIGSLSAKQTYKVLKNEDRNNPVVVKDFNFYGESLILYRNEYSYPGIQEDYFIGKTVVLKDLLSSQQYEFRIENTSINQQISLADLKEGFYSVYLKEGETVNRLVFQNKLTANTVFYTVHRDGGYKKIELIGRADYFDTPDRKTSVLDDNYFYLSVKEYRDDNNPMVDVVISTSPSLTSLNVSLNGVEAQGLVESEEMFHLGEEVADILQEHGVSVILLKASHNEGKLFYGSGGELNEAYDKHAKYMLHLDLEPYSSQIGIYYASNSNGALAHNIMDEMMLKTTLYDNGEEHCYPCGRVTSDLDSKDYDDEYEIRESGGEVLGAACYSASAQSNASFAAKNAYGIETVNIVAASFKDSASIEAWKKNRQMAAQGIAAGILKYLNIAY